MTKSSGASQGTAAADPEHSTMPIARRIRRAVGLLSKKSRSQKASLEVPVGTTQGSRNCFYHEDVTLLTFVTIIT